MAQKVDTQSQTAAPAMSAASSRKSEDFAKIISYPLPAGWEVKHSKTRDGKIYYYDSVTGVSTWKKPHSTKEQQEKLTPEDKGVKVKKKQSPKMKQSALSLIALQYKEQKDKDPLPSPGYSQKRKAEKGVNLGFSSMKIMKNRNISALKTNILERQKISRNNIQTLQRQKPVIKVGSVKKQILGSSNSNTTKNQEHSMDSKTSKRSFVSSDVSTAKKATKEIQNSITVASARMASEKKIAEANRRMHTKRALNDGSKTTSRTSDAVSQVKEKIEEDSPSDNKKIRFNEAAPVSKTLLGGDAIKRKDRQVSECVQKEDPSCESTQNRPMTPSQRVNTHLHTNITKKDGKSALSSYESLFPSQSSHCKHSTYSKEGSYLRNGPYSNNISTSVASEMNSDHAVYLHNSENVSLQDKNKKSSPFVNDNTVNKRSQSNNESANSGIPSSLSDLNTWSPSPVNSSWKTSSTAKYSVNAEGDNFSWTSNLRFNSGGQSSPNSTEVEPDIEDMEVDEEGLVILSNLQDVRVQTSLVPDEPRGVLTETVTRTQPSGLSHAADSMCETSKSQIFLIVDTNVLISCLKFLRDILSYKNPGHGDIILVLPWIVMQELDCLKNRKSSVNNLSISTSQWAAKAVKFIHSQLVIKNPRLIGQTPLEAREETELTVQCNDDRILQCCQQFEKKCAGSQVVLLTRDRNLINKAIIMGIRASHNETLWSCLKIPTPDFCRRRTSSEERSSSAETTDTRIIPLKSTDIITSSHAESRVLTEENEKVRASSPKAVTTALFQDSSVTPLRPSSLTKDLSNKTSVEDVHSTPVKMTVVQKQQPQTESEKTVIMNKFEAVWKLIYDIKIQIGAVLADGKSNANYSQAVQMLHVIIPLLSTLKENFSRCLSLSPVILWECETEFNALCTQLNTFFVQVETSCTDPSQPVDSLLLIKHFHESGNRPILLAGLEQLSAFLTDMMEMIKMCS